MISMFKGLFEKMTPNAERAVSVMNGAAVKPKPRLPGDYRSGFWSLGNTRQMAVLHSINIWPIAVLLMALGWTTRQISLSTRLLLTGSTPASKTNCSDGKGNHARQRKELSGFLASCGVGNAHHQLGVYPDQPFGCAKQSCGRTDSNSDGTVCPD